DRATYRRVFLAPHGRPGSVAHVHDLSRMHDGDSAVVALVFLELCFDLLRVANEEKLFDVRILAQRHDCSGDKIRRPEIAAHRIQGDLHGIEILRALAALCKMKIRLPSRLCLRWSKLADLYNNRTTDRRCVRERGFRIAGILSAADDASGWLLCASAIASLKFCVWGLPC